MYNLLLILILPIYCYCQDSVYFEFDKNFKFEHYTDYWKTKERFDASSKSLGIDTIYSCNYDYKGRIIEEYINDWYEKMTSFTTYDNNGRIKEIMNYYKCQGSKYNICNVEKKTFNYDNNLLKNIECLNCERKQLDDYETVDTSGSYKSYTITFGEFTDEWIYSNYYTVKIKYNENKQKVEEKEYHTGNPDNKTQYFYNKEGKLINKNFCKYAYFEDMSRDSSSCQYNIDKKYKYDGNSIKVIETSNMINKTKTITDTIFNKQKQPIEIKETFKNFTNGDFDRFKEIYTYNVNGKLILKEAYRNEIAWYKTEYKYNENGKLEKEIEYSVNKKSLVINYFYKTMTNK